MAVNDTITAFTRGGTLPGGPAGIGTIDCWRTEVPHPLTSSGKRNVRADAVFQDKAAGMPLLRVEVDRATESVHVLADKVGAYADFYARRVRDPAPSASFGRGRIGDLDTVPFWETLYRRTGLTGLPPLAIVLTGAGLAALDNRIRAVAGLSREHWAPQRETGSYHSVNPLDFTGRIPLVMTTLDRLQQHGPSGPVRLRIDGYRPADGQPLLQALADIHTEAEYDQRQKQREQAAKAERQHREEAEEREREAEWARWEWFEARERRMEAPAGLWDEAGAEGDQ